ncbi:DNA mismatch repair protein MutT [Agaricicola taiwanensis]|uniref:DNA mismatch repair protein MutT n=1 Tax=Agaricicola taiwanensis TaxID=591372 RepID=A0A8J2VS98_9RHOB|nr:NUDIX domain-containing protein [Agaricicola taiwanensis]GGE39931.1 DNA mismatch repair protein MutT [Agaricicola taiwanensis]
MMQIFKPLVRNVLALYWRMSRGLTLGVRAIVIDGDRVLLVRHGYVAGWHLPGGGVEAGETAQTALVRELEEETGVAAMAPGRLMSVHHHAGLAGRDHVLVYQVTDWRAGPVPPPTKEIAEIGWFSLDALPPGVTRATRTRLMEMKEGSAPDPSW